MSLKDDARAELYLDGLFFDTEEVSSWREFVLSDGSRDGRMTIRMPVQWDEDAMRQKGIELAPSGIILGDVIVYSRLYDWPRRPLPNEYIESPAGLSWEIIKSIENDGVLELLLRSTRANY